MIGKTIAQYTIAERIGAGGMGEVYRARDTKLDRDVAIKFLPDALASDGDRLARFRREAKVLAALNHAHIATLHDLLHEGGQHFLVMELVSGDDLSTLIQRGPLPPNEAMAIIRQVAEALEAAHGQGIVHRDLKPANIKVLPDGKIKVLDFGLAKMLEAEGASPNISHSPTVAITGTVGGMILGTAAYMSPEQARGKPIDKRTDIWAAGCILFEMLAGKQAYPGETVSDTIAKILEREPDWAGLPATTPPALVQLIRRCLEKDSTRRLPDVAEVRIQVDDSLSGVGEVAIGATDAERGALGPSARTGALWKVATVVATVAALALAVSQLRREAPRNAVFRATIPPPAGGRYLAAGDLAGPVVVSPDGERVAFVAVDDEGARRLWIRPVGRLEARALPVTSDVTFPFWSPDSRSVGFFADQKLKRIDLDGESVITLCDAPAGRGGTWSVKGDILFSANYRTPIYHVPAAGGIPTAVTQIDSTRHSTHRWPQFMPDGEHFVFVAAHHDVSRSQFNAVYFASLDEADAPKVVVSYPTSAVFASEHLLYVRDNTLLAAPFDAATGELRGEPVLYSDRVQYDPTTWLSGISASQTGVLVYHPETEVTNTGTRLAWFDREGKDIGLVAEADAYYGLALSPDNTKLAVTVAPTSAYEYDVDIWVYDIERGVRSRLTFEEGTDVSPVWSPDGRLAYARVFPAAQGRRHSIIVREVGGGEAEVLLDSDDEVWPTGWSSDGRYLAFSRGVFVGGVSDIWILPLFDDREPFPLVATDAPEGAAVFSPNGRWIAYQSYEGGIAEVFVVPFRDPGPDAPSAPSVAENKWQISSRSGVNPTWRADGKELFFFSIREGLWSAEVTGDRDEFSVGVVKPLFFVTSYTTGTVEYEASSDGQRFVINTFADRVQHPVHIVVNWDEELRSQR